MPKVSIIVPVYNVSDFLPRCLDSLVNQTLKDIEIIVVNDGSTDESQAIIDTYSANYPHIIKAFKKQNGGLSDARNFGIKRATGDFLGFVDSDDFVDTTMFKKLYHKAYETDSDIVICAHNTVLLKWKCTIKSSAVHPLKNEHAFGKSIYDSPEILAFSRSYAWNKLYKKEVFENFEFPKGQYFEDSAVVYNILSAAKKIEIVNEPLYNYVVGRSGAITQGADARVFDIIKSCDSIIKHYKKIDKFEALKPEIESLCLMHIHARFALFTKKGSLSLKLKFVDAAFDFIEKNFPNWRENKYYLERRAPYFNAKTVKPYFIARESRNKLKRYYLLNYVKATLLRIMRKVKKLISA